MTFFNDNVDLPKEVSESTSTTKTLSFEKIDTGDFLFWDFKKDAVFTGKYKGFWQGHDKGGDKPVSGLEFIEHGTNQRYILSESYKLVDFFHMNPNPAYDYDNGIFQIHYKGQKELSGGKEISLFDFAYAKP